MSGVRGSPVGGSPGGLKSCVMPVPKKICPMPAILVASGDCSSSIFTAIPKVQLLFSQTKETSSSVGPIPEGFKGDSEKGMQPPLARMVAGDVVTSPDVVIGVKREETT